MEYDGNIEKWNIGVYVLMWKTLCILVKRIRFEAVCSLLFWFKGDSLFILIFWPHRTACGTRDWTWALPGPGQWKHVVLTTEPPGNSLKGIVYSYISISWCMPKIYMVNIHEKFSVCVKEIHLMGSFRERGTLTFQFESVFKFKLYTQLI